MKKILWSEISAKEQNLYLTVLWQDGYSEKAIADFFSATKNQIVRRRRTLKLLNENRPVVRKVVNPERFPDLLALHALEEQEKAKDNPPA